MKKLALLSLIAVSSAAMSQELPNIKLQDKVITYDGFESTVGKTSKTIYVVTSQEIEENGFKTLPEALSMVPGVRVAEGFDGNGMIDIRGQGKDFNRNIAIIVDGVKLNPIDWGNVNLYTIPVDTIERIEVIPQNASVLFGDRAIGGAINIVTKNAQKRDYINFGEVLSSYKGNKENVGFNTTVGNTTVFGDFVNLTNYGYRDNSKMTQKNINLGFKTNINKNHSVMVKYNHNDTDKKLPGGLNKEQYEENRRQEGTNWKGVHPKEWKTSKSNRYTVNYTYHKDNLSIVNEASFQRTIERGNSFYKVKNLNEFDNSLRLKYATDSNSFITGIDYSNGKAKFPRTGYSRTDKKESIAGFVENTYSLTDKIDLDGGIRVERSKYKWSKNFVVKPSGKIGDIEDKTYTNIAFDFGGSYKYSETGKTYISAGRDYRTPLTRELVSSNGYHDDITPQEQYSLELGIRDNIEGVYIDSAIYYELTKDQIYYQVMDKNFKKAYGDGGYNTNYDGKTQRFGYELLLEKDILDNLRLSTSYSYINDKFKTGQFKDKYLPGVSKHKIGMGVHYSPVEDLHTNLLGNYYGSSYAWGDELNNREKVKGYMTFDFNINYNLNEYLNIYAGVKNLTNKKYCERIERKSNSKSEKYYPAMGRRYFAGFNYKFF